MTLLSNPVSDFNHGEFSFLSGGGEMGRLMRALDWRKTSLGSVNTWPQSLRTTLSIILHSKFPMFLFWGPQLLCFYNDAYRPSLGNEGKHPNALGKPGEEAWPETWPIIKPLIEGVLSGGEATWSQDQLIPIYRNGKMEDVYWTFSYSPVSDESGKVAGVFVTCVETTEKVTNFKQLEESKNQLAFAIEATELATWDLNPVTNQFTANARYSEWFGLPATNETDNDLALKVIADEDRERVIAAYTKALDYSSESKYDIEYTIRPENKPKRILRAKGKAWFNNDKTAYRFNGTLQDVTGQVLARKKVEESEEQLRIALEGAQLGTYDFNPQTGKLIWSAKTKELFGLPPESEVDYSIYLKALHPEDKERSHQAAQRAMQPENGGWYDNEYRTIGITDGKLRWVRSKGKIVFDAEGKPVRFTGVTQDITERKRAEEALKESEQRFRALIAEATVATGIYTGREMKIELANEAMIQFWGKDASAIGKTIRQALPELEGQPFHQLLDNVYTTGNTYWGKEDRVNLVVNGKLQTGYFNFTYKALRNGEGEIYGILNMAIDVTETVLARKTIEESEQRFRMLANQVPQFIWMTGSIGTLEVTYVNKNFLDYLGLSHYKEFLGTTWEDTIHPDDLGRVYEIYLSAAQARQAYTVECRFKEGATGLYRWFIIQGVPRYEAEGEFAGFIGTGVDIDERKQVESALAENEERFRSMADNISQLVWMADGEGSIFWYNKRWYDYTGTNLEEMQGWGWDKVHHPDHISRVLEFVRPAWKKGQPWELDFPLRRYDGQYGWFLTRAVPIRDIEGNIALWFGTNTDITEQQLAQQQLQTLNEELAATTEELAAANEELQAANEEIQASNEELGETNHQLVRINNDLDNFIYTASHDLKAPISNIEALLSALLRTLPQECLASEQTRRITSLMGESVERFKRTIANLTEVVKLQKEHGGEAVSVNLLQVIREVILDLEPMVQSSDARVEVDVTDCLPVRFSEKNLRSVVYNLLSNALKYRSRERVPRVLIHCQNTPEYYVLAVEDNGLGMESERLSQLFTMFKRFHDHVEGSGIGLYMVKKMVENAGGRIEVESQVGVGSTFKVYFRR